MARDGSTDPGLPAPGAMTPKLLLWALAVQLVLGGLLLWQAATGFSLFRGGDHADHGNRGAAGRPAAVAAAVPAPRVDRFDAAAAMAWARRQVALGPRPAGSPAERRAGELLRRALPGGRFVPVGGGLRNVLGRLPGRGRPILLIAHYDTTPVPGYLGANNSAAAVGAVVEIARALRGTHGRPVDLLLTDGEEAPTYPVRGDFATQGLRGSRAAARTMRPADAIVLDFVGNRGLRLPREAGSDPALWARLRAAAGRVGVESAFPDAVRGEILDDHTPFARRGVPAIDLIDFDYPCWQRTCDTMAQVSRRSVDAVGETVVELVRTLR